MRKITSVLFALLCLCTTAWAQPQGEPLITSASQLSSPFSDEAEGQDLGALIDFNNATFWHTDWHEKVEGNYHWLQIELPQEMQGQMTLWVKRRSCDNDHPTTVILSGSLADDFATEVALGTVELGEGWSGGQATVLFNIPEPVKYIRFMPINVAGKEAFRKFWHAAEINLYEHSNNAEMDEQMNQLLLDYDQYLYEPDFNIGTGVGQFTDEASANEFLKILEKVNKIISGEIERPSNEEIAEMVASARSLFATYLTSKVEYSIPGTGYYRIIANLDYFAEVPTGEVDQYGEPITVRKGGVRKTLYSHQDGYAGWHTYDANDCRDIWHLSQNGDKTVNAINAATRMSWSNFGDPILMSADPNKYLFSYFEWVGNEEGRDILYIRGYGYDVYWVFHQQGHQRGDGISGKIANWEPTFNMGAPYSTDKGTSEWYLEPVPEDEAQALIEQYSILQNREAMVKNYRDIAGKAQMEIQVAQDAYRELHVRSNAQFSSQVTEATEGSLNNLLDNNVDTYWHSAYTGPRTGTMGGTHALDVTFAEPVQGTMKMWVQRRVAAANDHPTLWSVYGSNDEAALASVADFSAGGAEQWRAQTTQGWTLIAQNLATPYDASVAEVTSPAFEVNTPYRYMRFVCEESVGRDLGTRGFFHLGGFQVYSIEGQSQLQAMGEIGAQLVASIERAAAISDEDITDDDFTSLQAAYNAFKALYCDPSPLRQTVEDYRDFTKVMAVGQQPGYWSDEAAAIALNEAVKAAIEYDKTGLFTQEGLAAKADAIQQAAHTFLASANQVDPNQWYRLRFPTEDLYTGQNWGAANVRADEGSALGHLWGQYAAVGRYLSTGEYEGNPIVETLPTEEMRERDGLYFAQLDNISNPDAALFRFVPMNDHQFAIQNKATGLYVTARYANSNEVVMSLEPTLFSITPVGFGNVIISGTSLTGGNVTNLHAQRWNHRLVTWESAEAWSNSGLWIEPAGQAVSEMNNAFVRAMVPGQIYVGCDAAAIMPVDNEDVALYTMPGTYTVDGKSYIALRRIQATQAGVPYIAILGATEDYVASDDPDTELVTFTRTGIDFVGKPVVLNGLTGTYTATTAPEGAVVFVGNQAQIAKDELVQDQNGTYVTVSNRAIPAGSGFLSFGYVDADPAEYFDLVIQVNGNPNVTSEIERHEGTEDDPFLILTPKDMALLRSMLVAGRCNYVKLGADIDMASIKNWEPLNMYYDYANGGEYQNHISLDGQGHVIRNFHCTKDDQQYNSFFGVLNGDVKNVGFENVNVSCLATGSGALAGYMGHDQYKDADGNKRTSTLTNVWVTGRVFIGDNYGGGLIGNVGGPTVLTNIYTRIDLSGNAGYMGGLVGRVRDRLDITNAYAAGTISTGGGIIGGGQKDSTAPATYKNIVVWNNIDNNFGNIRQGVDTAEGISYYNGENFTTLQQTVLSWGAPWACDTSDWNFPYFGQGTIDAIQAVADKPAHSGIYTINGIRVQKTTSGLYIIDGRKVMVK